MSAPKKFDDKTMTGRELRDLNSVVTGPEDPMNVWAYYWIARRREVKDMTWDDALDADIATITEYLGIDNPLTTSK